MPTFKLGKSRPQYDHRTLKLRKYLRDSFLPPLKTAAGWSDFVLNKQLYPMLMNDQIGDCAVAGPMHMIQTMTAASQGQVAQFSDDDAVRVYSAISGYKGTPETDNGCNLLDVCNYWRKFGIRGHKIRAFAQISGRDELQYAVQLFGGALLGVALPNSAVSAPDMLAFPWDDSVTDPGNPNNGHCIITTDFDLSGQRVVTWGSRKSASWNFLNRYMDEGYVVISDDWINQATGQCPAGLDLDALLKDLSAVTGDTVSLPAAPAPGKKSILVVSGFTEIVQTNDPKEDPIWQIADNLERQGHTVTRRQWNTLTSYDLMVPYDGVIGYSYGVAALWEALHAIAPRFRPNFGKLFIIAGVPRVFWDQWYGTVWTVPDCFASAVSFNVASLPMSVGISNTSDKFVNVECTGDTWPGNFANHCSLPGDPRVQKVIYDWASQA